MARKRTGWPLIIVGGIVVGLLLVACLGLIWWKSQPQGIALPREFKSNGEQIYFTATSQRGTPILSDMGMGMMGGMMSCASCHGPDGRGGRIWMMMRAFIAPDIRYKTLTSAEHAEEHKPYTDEDIKQAITRGIEPDGEMLEWPMPRWTMSEEDLNDLLEFLKTLE